MIVCPNCDGEKKIVDPSRTFYDEKLGKWHIAYMDCPTCGATGKVEDFESQKKPSSQ